MSTEPEEVNLIAEVAGFGVALLILWMCFTVMIWIVENAMGSRITLLRMIVVQFMVIKKLRLW